MSDKIQKNSIRDWWADAPMTYAQVHGSTSYRHADGTTEEVSIDSKRFYELADAVFMSWNTPLHGSGGPFSNLFPFDAMRGKKVLEVGCGMGFMAMQWALHGADVTAVDLNPVAVANSKHRFETFDLQGSFQEADGENLPFTDNEFDYVYSWGVLHHSPSPHRSIGELYRVLAPGGTAGVMLYNRNSFLAQYVNAFVEGVINLENCFLTPLELQSRYGDGHREEGNFHTWPVTRTEVKQHLFKQFKSISIDTLGTDIGPVLWHWLPAPLNRLPFPLMKALARRWGWSLWITGVK